MKGLYRGANIHQMEECSNTRNLEEQPSTIHNEHVITSEGQPTPPPGSQRTAIEYPALDSSLLPQVPLGANYGRAQYSARGEPAIHVSPPVQNSTLSTCRQIFGLLGQITVQQDGILRELRAIRREMRFMKGEQRRTNARMISMAHDLEELKEHFL